MKVRIPGLLRAYTGGERMVRLAFDSDTAPTLADVLAALEGRFAGLRFRVIDEQAQVRPHIKLFVDGELVSDLRRTVPANAELMIVGALSGG